MEPPGHCGGTFKILMGGVSMMKKYSAVLSFRVAAFLFLTMFGISACAPYMESAKGGKKAKPKVSQNTFLSCSMSGTRKSCVSVSPTPAKPEKGKILIAGSGFKPKQELGIRVMMGGVLSDISFLVKPRPIVNEYGAFASTWGLRGREFKRGLLQAGTVYTVTIVDEDGNTLATAPFVIDKAKKKKKKMK